MKSADRLKSLEARTYQAQMLHDARNIGGLHGESYAAIVCALAERDALKIGCDELREMATAYYARPASDFIGGENPGDVPDGFIATLLLWDVFNCSPLAWRLPGGETALIKALSDEDEKLTGMDNKAVKAFLNSEIERLARIKEDENHRNPTAEA